MKEITFINKTTSSREVSRSTPEERKRINERNREHRARRRNPILQHTTRPQSGFKVEFEEDLRSFQPQGSSVAINPLESGTIPLAKAITQRTTQLVCPLTGTSFADPFNTFSIPMSSEHWQVIQFYRDIYYKRLWFTVNAILGTVLDRFDFTRCTPDVVITECLRIPSRMWSLLASSSCNLQHETNLKMQSMNIINSGTASLRSDLENSKLDRHALLNSIHLHLAARSLNQDQIAAAHLKGARAILRELIRHGEIIPPPTLGMVSLVDGELAAHLLETKACKQEDVRPTGRKGELLILDPDGVA